MAQPYVGEIRMFAGNFAPAGWMFCDGSILSISENETLFQLIGTTYGGDGQDTFALPNLQSRIPVHKGTNNFGTSYILSQMGGVEEVTLSQNQIPIHKHIPLASNTGGYDNPANNYWANSATGKPYNTGPPTIQLNAASINTAGGSQPHDNMMPFLCVSYIISLFGIFPSQV